MIPMQSKNILKNMFSNNNIIIKIDHVKRGCGNDLLFFRLDKGKIGAMIGFYSSEDNRFHKTHSLLFKQEENSR